MKEVAARERPSLAKFLAYRQERDGLGRLIQSDNPERLGQIGLKAHNSVQESSMVASRMCSDQLIEKLFRLKEVSQGYETARESLRVKQVHKKQYYHPTIGHYNVSEITEGLKFKKSLSCRIKPMKADSDLQLQPLKLMIVRSQSQQNLEHAPRQPNFKQAIKKPIVVNYNLPELKLYNELKRYQLKLCDNFDQCHTRFKDKVRYAQLLASKIRKQLESD